MSISGHQRRTAFSIWMRTGRWPRGEASKDVEVKFNPWHDPRDGRFTFGPSGRQSGDRKGPDPEKVLLKEDPNLPPIITTEQARLWKADMLAKYGHWHGYPAAIKEKYNFYMRRIAAAKRHRNSLSEAGEFVTGLGEGIYSAGKDTVTGLYKIATDPIGTTYSAGVEVAKAFDAALVAEDTPAYVQYNRAMSAMANASAHDWGYGLGKAGGNLALTMGPGAIVARVSASARAAALEASAIPKGPPKITWVDETPTFRGPHKERAKAYNDSANGARSNVATKKGQAPALERTMPNGEKRLVKFDGTDFDPVYDHVLIDRKHAVVSSIKSRGQILRQAQALSQHNLIGIWEVPTLKELRKANKILKQLKVSNIKVRIVKI